MRYEFPLPDPGEGLTEAEIVEWFVAEGADVTEDEPLCDVETDKAVVEIPAPCTGRLEQRTESEGTVVAVGDVIAVFETENPPVRAGREGAAAQSPEQPASTGNGELSDAESDAKETQRTDASQPVADASPQQRVFAAPSTRRFAREQGVALAQVDGTGPGGRILQADVEAHVNGRKDRSPTDGEQGDLVPVNANVDTGETVRRPLRGLRRTIAENMVRSKRAIPHVTSGFEADAEAFVELRNRLNEKHDERISYTALMVKAVVPALQAFPEVNASIDDDAEEIVEKRYYHVGVATHTDDGLLVPVVRNVEQKSLVEVAAELERLAEGARDRSLDATDLQGSTFTITNVGSHSEHGTFGTPIINHPEAAILGMGRIRRKPVAVGDDIEVRRRLGLSLSFDHRLVDGVTAAEFAESVIESIEDPDILLSRI